MNKQQAAKSTRERDDDGGMAALSLQSLTPSFSSQQHATYVRRLEQAIQDPRNLNIALTGRYGAGKSSILDQFEANHRSRTQRLAIATLGTGTQGEETTNRIQKEIVKHLLYGASHKVGKGSRFNKIASPRLIPIFLQSLAAVVVVGGLLLLLGWLPTIRWTGPNEVLGVRGGAWLVTVLFAAAVVTTVRMVTYGRFNVENVAAGGAALSLRQKPDSFFDKYLDEIVHYFDRESKDIVIFEDLDRFGDRQIFEALRELNLLLNETPSRKKKRRRGRCAAPLRWLLGLVSDAAVDTVASKLPKKWRPRLLGSEVPLRFIYAVKDSVFGEIETKAASSSPTGGDEEASSGEVDVAAHETERANRTKFFDIVIPVVPFISHRNARDLLDSLLQERHIEGIEPRLVNTLARYCTDMRLMRNICNEYLVFAERLLEPQGTHEVPPGMNHSLLFALIAYKNFHLEDFEKIVRRESDLDRLYDLHHDLVRASIEKLEESKRTLRGKSHQVRTRAHTAEQLGERLAALIPAVRKHPNYRHQWFRVGDDDVSKEDVTSYSFWLNVAKAQELTLVESQYDMGTNSQATKSQFDGVAIEAVFPEAMDASRWESYDRTALADQLKEIDQSIMSLREADFAELLRLPEFTLARTGDPSNEETFEDILEDTLTSELARELVRAGYIDRNFSLYAAQFYGTFTGVDVATFVVQHVQTNTMAVDYDLSRSGAVANVIAESEELGVDITRSLAALNIDICNHLLSADTERGHAWAERLVADGISDDEHTFLAAYLTATDTHSETLVRLLTEHGWRDIFTYIVGDHRVPDDARPRLFSATASAYASRHEYKFDESVANFVRDNYASMPAFAKVGHEAADAERHAATLHALLERAGVVIPDLGPIRSSLRSLLISDRRYPITAGNLRCATGGEGELALDDLIRHDDVYDYCLDDIDAYLSAIQSDPQTQHAVRTAQTLIRVLEDMVATGKTTASDDPAALLKLTSPDARVDVLRKAPEAAWPALAAARLIRPSVANVESYRASVGAIDGHLAGLLEEAGTLLVESETDRCGPDDQAIDLEPVAIAVLNAESLSPATRVGLVSSLGELAPLTVEDIEPRADELFALLLEAGLVPDELTSFMHFKVAGWPSLGPATRASKSFATMMTPDLVVGLVKELLQDSATPSAIARKVVEHLDEYVPSDDWPTLKAVAEFAVRHQMPLDPESVLRMARVAEGQSDADTTAIATLLAITVPPATADQVSNAFACLGGRYAGAVRPGGKTKLDETEAHKKLVATLKDAGRISSSKVRNKPLIQIEVL